MKQIRNKANILIEDDNAPIYVNQEEADLFENAIVVKDVRHTSAYKKWVLMVKEFFNYTCQCCGKKSDKMEAHHAFSFKHFITLRLSLKNGICLCPECHRAYHKEYPLKQTSPGTLFLFSNKMKKIIGNGNDEIK